MEQKGLRNTNLTRKEVKKMSRKFIPLETRFLMGLIALMCALGLLLYPALGFAQDTGVEFKVMDDLTVQGAEGTSSDPDVDILGYTQMKGNLDLDPNAVGENLTFDKVITAAAAYVDNEFVLTRVITGAAWNLSGDLLRIWDKSSTTGTNTANLLNLGSGTTFTSVFAVDGSGNLAVGGTTTLGGLTYTWPGTQTASYILTTDGAGLLSWGAIDALGGITAVGDVTSGDAFNGSQGNTLTFEGTGAGAGDILLAGSVAPGANVTVTIPTITGTLITSADTATVKDFMIDLGTGANQLSAVDLADFGTMTATSGNLLLANGTDFNSVTMSGDVLITSAGATTIQADSVALATDTTGNYVATITAGNGLTGDVAAEASAPTLAVVAGDTTLTVNADNLVVNQAHAFAWTGNQSFGGATTLTGATTLAGVTTSTKVNAAGGSADAFTASGTLSAMDGNDTFRGIFLDYINADHAGTANAVYALDIDTITQDPDATEVALKIGSGWDRQIALIESVGTFYTTFKTGDQAATINYTLPAIAPAASQVLSSDASGILTWSDVTAVGSAPDSAEYVVAASDTVLTAERVISGIASEIDIDTATAGSIKIGIVDPLVITKGGTGLSALGTANKLLGVNDAAGALEYIAVSGTTDQVNVTQTGSAITLSTPQSINTISAPRFARLGLGAAAHATDPLNVSGIAHISGNLHIGGGYSGGGISVNSDGTLQVGSHIYLKGAVYEESVQKLRVADNTIVLNSEGSAQDAFIQVNATAAELKWDQTNTRWDIANNMFLRKSQTATSVTQYPSRDLILQASGWNTTTPAENTLVSSLRLIPGSGATGSIPYRLAILNNAGTEFVSFDGLNGDMQIKAQGDLQLADADSSNYVGFQAPGTVAANVLYTLPAADGTTGQVLKTDGSKTLAWSDVTAVGAAPVNAQYIVSATNTTLTNEDLISGTASEIEITGAGTGTLTIGIVDPLAIAKGGTGLSADGAANQVLAVQTGGSGLEYKTISGTTNQVTVTPAAGSITLSGPQDIHTAATPQFAKLGLGTPAGTEILKVSGDVAVTTGNITLDTLQKINLDGATALSYVRHATDATKNQLEFYVSKAGVATLVAVMKEK